MCSCMTGNNIFCHYCGMLFTLNLSCRVQDPLILPDLKDTLTLSTSYNRKNNVGIYLLLKVSERFSQTVHGCMWRTVKVDFFPEVLWVWENHCSEDSIHCHELATEKTVSLTVNLIGLHIIMRYCAPVVY